MIHVYTVAHDEAAILPYFLRHYGFAARIVVYDNLSTDGTPEIARAAGCEVVPYDTGGTMDELSLLRIKNHCWKSSRGADWVIVCDLDEFLYHDDPVGYLDRMKAEGVTVPVPTGYQMVGEGGLPPDDGRQLWEHIKMGAEDRQWARKYLVFDPSAIDEIGYGIGCHTASPTGRVVYREPSELRNLHFHNLGIEYLVTRYANRRPRITSAHRAKGWLCYDQSREFLEGRLAGLREHADWVLNPRL